MITRNRFFKKIKTVVFSFFDELEYKVSEIRRVFFRSPLQDSRQYKIYYNNQKKVVKQDFIGSNEDLNTQIVNSFEHFTSKPPVKLPKRNKCYAIIEKRPAEMSLEHYERMEDISNKYHQTMKMNLDEEDEDPNNPYSSKNVNEDNDEDIQDPDNPYSIPPSDEEGCSFSKIHSIRDNPEYVVESELFVNLRLPVINNRANMGRNFEQNR